MCPKNWTERQKSDLINRTKQFLLTTIKLTNNIHRIKFRASRIYLIALFKVSHPEMRQDSTKLINGQYIEYNFARITVNDAGGEYCSADWQASDGKSWLTLHRGSLEECLAYVENDTTGHFSL